MGIAKDVDLTCDRLFSLGWGLVFCAVCAPKDWPSERVALEATLQDPPGTWGNEWAISEPEEREGPFNNTNCFQCPDSESRQHWLLNC